MNLDPQSVAHALGGEISGRNSVSAPGPGHSRGDRSLSITLDSGAPDGFILNSFAGNDWSACRDYVRERLGLGRWEPSKGKRAPQFKAADSGPDPDKEKKKEWALRLWTQSVNPTGTLVERYLREHRGLELNANVAGSVVRFHAGLKFDEQYVPGMVCLLRDIVTDEPCGIHRTFLDRKTAQKIDRKMLGVAKGAAIKLDRHEDVKGALTIGEGVETVLAARMMGFAPVWALGSSVAVGNFPVLKDLTGITILEENDPTSRRDVETCGRRYYYAGTPVKVITPNAGKDMNDAWRAVR